jgi:hypothetical protein
MEVVERQKITINKVTYYLDSLDEEAQKILGEIRIIDTEMHRLNIQMNIAGVAKNSLLEKIDANSENFEKVPEEPEEPSEKEEPAYINQ